MPNGSVYCICRLKQVYSNMHTCFDSMAVEVIFSFSFCSSSSSEATTPSSDPRENPERPTSLQQPHAGVTSASHCGTRSISLYKSNSSPGCYSHDKKCSVKSDVSKSPSGEYSRPKSVRSNVNVKCDKQRLSPRSGEVKLGLPENDPPPLSSRSNVKSKVSWV